ncbi:MAG TPA: HEAT repeat domain-containing protein, partial [Candidatus Aminicenantes bacterium]|nr:HEAT repeat domain-containing protein [Candidatus Aminicenantes bacterium]
MAQRPISTFVPVNAETIRQIRDIVGRFVHTIAAMRLYPFGHVNVTKFRDNLFQRLSAFLEEQGEFEIEIKEDAFTFAGGPVFQEESGIKSLPYLYYNDGMRALTFLPGLTREELFDFLAITADYAERAEEGDIIEDLWERDFEFIRYDAADGFLEARVAAGTVHRPKELQIDREHLFSGRIQLDAEDKAAAHARSVEISRTNPLDGSVLAEFFRSIDGGERSNLESLVSAEHEVSVDKEFIATVFEVLYLEDRLDSFRQILTYMKTYLKILIKKADIGNALFLLNSISDLRKALLASSPARAEDLLQTIRLITQETDLDIIRDIARPERIEDPRPLFEFLVWFGPRTLPTAIEACEAAVDPLWREACVEYLRVMVRDCLSETAAQIRNRKPELIQTLITLLGDRGDKKAILHLADLARSGNPEIRLEAVRTLGGLSHDLARKLTLEFLLDPDERIRIEAGQAARLESDENALARMIQIVSRKNFLARSSTERGAMLLALGRSNTGPAAKALETLVRKRRLLGGERLRETRLLAVSGLAVMNIPQAREALAAGVKVSNQA